MRTRRCNRSSAVAPLIAFSLLGTAVGCGEAGTDTPPSGLIYSLNPAVYRVGIAITPNTPSSSGGAVASYSAAPALPAGLSLNTTTGVVSGTPVAVTSVTTYTVTATNSAGGTTAGLTITVNDLAPSGLTYATNPAIYAVGTVITPNTPTSAGGAVTSYGVSPELPAGLGLNALTGVIAGTPATAMAAANFEVTATNSGGSTSAIISVAVRGVIIFAICSPPDPDATTGACLYPATCTTVLAGTPVLDVTTAQLDLRLPVQINNTLLNNSGGGQINTNDAAIQSFEMTYTGAALAPWTVGAAVTVPTAGSSGALLRLIPVAYFPALAPSGSSTVSIVVSVRAHGFLYSQDSFTTAWFQVPVTVCAGCLASTFACMIPAVLVTCPSAVAPGVAPGQTATTACATLK